jgi:hypothetical protein
VRAILLVTLTGCAQIFGLQDTKFDFQDAPTDSPSVCDGPGMTCVPSSTGRTVCGRLQGTGGLADLPIRADAPTGAACKASTTAPCALTVTGMPLASFLNGATTGEVAGTVDDCGRYTIPNLDMTAADVAIIVEGTGFKRTASLVFGRMTSPGVDDNTVALVVSDATLADWGTQIGSGTPPDMSAGYLIRYTTMEAPLAGEVVAKDGMTPFMNPVGTVPWAGYFSGTSSFATLDKSVTSTQVTGTAFAVLGGGTFTLEGFRVGKRCHINGLAQVASSLVFVTQINC